MSITANQFSEQAKWCRKNGPNLQNYVMSSRNDQNLPHMADNLQLIQIKFSCNSTSHFVDSNVYE